MSDIDEDNLSLFDLHRIRSLLPHIPPELPTDELPATANPPLLPSLAVVSRPKRQCAIKRKAESDVPAALDPSDLLSDVVVATLREDKGGKLVLCYAQVIDRNNYGPEEELSLDSLMESEPPGFLEPGPESWTEYEHRTVAVDVVQIDADMYRIVGPPREVLEQTLKKVIHKKPRSQLVSSVKRLETYKPPAGGRYLLKDYFNPPTMATDKMIAYGKQQYFIIPAVKVELELHDILVQESSGALVYFEGSGVFPVIVQECLIKQSDGTFHVLAVTTDLVSTYSTKMKTCSPRELVRTQTLELIPASAIIGAAEIVCNEKLFQQLESRNPAPNVLPGCSLEDARMALGLQLRARYLIRLQVTGSDALYALKPDRDMQHMSKLFGETYDAMPGDQASLVHLEAANHVQQLITESIVTRMKQRRRKDATVTMYLSLVDWVSGIERFVGTGKAEGSKLIVSLDVYSPLLQQILYPWQAFAGLPFPYKKAVKKSVTDERLCLDPSSPVVFVLLDGGLLHSRVRISFNYYEEYPDPAAACGFRTNKLGAMYSVSEQRDLQAELQTLDDGSADVNDDQLE